MANVSAIKHSEETIRPPSTATSEVVDADRRIGEQGPNLGVALWPVAFDLKGDDLVDRGLGRPLNIHGCKHGTTGVARANRYILPGQEGAHPCAPTI